MKANAIRLQCRTREEVDAAREITLILQPRREATPRYGFIAGSGRREVELLGDRVTWANRCHMFGEQHSNHGVAHLLSGEQDAHRGNGASYDLESETIASDP